MISPDSFTSYFNGKLPGLFNDFLELFLNATPLYILESHPENFMKEAIIECFESFSKQEGLKRIEHKQSVDILIIHKAIPFLLESIGILLNQKNINPIHFIHPVLQLSDHSKDQNLDDQSYVAFIVLRLTKKDAKLIQDAEIKDIIKQVTFIHDDWHSIQHDINVIKDSAKATHKDEASFLGWLMKNNFIFLGCRVLNLHPHANHLPLLNENPCGLFREKEYSSLSFSFMDNKGTQYTKNSPLILKKVSRRSPIHRSSRLEVIEWVFRKEGEAQAIFQLIGIYTKEMFRRPVEEIPLLQYKAKDVMQKCGVLPQWHDGKLVSRILESIPRDEMFYIDSERLFKIIEGVLSIHDNRRLVSFIRTVPDQSFATILIFCQKDLYSHSKKEEMGEKICNFFTHNGYETAITSSYGFVNDNHFALIVYVVSFSQPEIEILCNESKLQEFLNVSFLSWKEQIQQHLKRNFEIDFNKEYKSLHSQEEVCEDIETIEGMQDIAVRLYKKSNTWHLKIFYDQTIGLSYLTPLLKNLGLDVQSENTFRFYKNNQDYYIYDLVVIPLAPPNKELWYEGFYSVWRQKCENDELNQLIILADLSIKEVIILKAYTRYLKQIINVKASTALLEYPKIAKECINYFNKRFLLKQNTSPSEERIHFHEVLQPVKRFDQDQALRYLFTVMQATVRTNAFLSRPYISFKIESQLIGFLPSPKPMYEIFVYSPRFEAIHLRGSKIARGGIRWSDRLDDYRTEILGLMKAQMVKNAIIVPMGAKGGFILKCPPLTSKEVKEEAIACYQLMITALIEMTDNVIDHKIVKPQGLVCYDGEDPYLVVAADKGTATFSDIANEISIKNNFWLGDAFASGGQTGYDHKAMAITSKGAWLSACHHLNKLHLNPEKDPVTVVGIGDMSGDVFGNGMLRSQTIHLLAAFNHMHIFIDPSPEPMQSFNERYRLFTTSGSTWADYNNELISKGGGVFDRNAKQITLSNEIKALLKTDATELSPDDIIRHILMLNVDMIWFGGIGTYVKSEEERSLDVGDPNNDRVRINANQVKAKVIVEGANLGITQKGRIEYSLLGGHINVDAIDNSAGVDCSDHEVNIKILTNQLQNQGKLSYEARNTLLKEMQDDVAIFVLEDNIQQNRILTLMEPYAHWDNYRLLLGYLTKIIQLDPELECLPNDAIIQERIYQEKLLTRPELSILMAYSKNALTHRLIQENYQHETLLTHYFPSLIRKKFPHDIKEHLLAKEIVATVAANQFINRLGIFFLPKYVETTAYSETKAVQAFSFLDSIFGLNNLWERLDKKGDCHNQAPYHDLAQWTEYAIFFLSNQLDFSQSNQLDNLIQLSKSLPLIHPSKSENLTKDLTLHLNSLLIAWHLQEDFIKISNLYTQILSQTPFTHIQELLIRFSCKASWEKDMILSLQKKLLLMEIYIIQRILTGHNLQLSHLDFSKGDGSLSFIHYYLDKTKTIIETS